MVGQGWTRDKVQGRTNHVSMTQLYAWGDTELGMGHTQLYRGGGGDVEPGMGHTQLDGGDAEPGMGHTTGRGGGGGGEPGMGHMQLYRGGGAEPGMGHTTGLVSRSLDHTFASSFI